jgi:hypothetical protein
MKFHRIALALILLIGFLQIQAQTYAITTYGAKGDGLTLNTVPIQTAIDSCAANGGGRVVVPQGTFRTGSIRLKNGVTLELQKGATLLGDTRRLNYQKNKWYALVLAQGARNIGIVGEGTIDGQGTALAANTDSLYKAGLIQGGYRDNRTHESERPQLIDFEQCTNVHIQGITLQNSACWIQRYGRCDSLVIEHIKVVSMAFWNNDGIDLVDCTNTLVQNCDINAADDGICLKSDGRDLCCNHILIRNCRVRSSASALKFGTNSYGGFKNIKVEGLEVYDTYRSAIALETVDGGVMENIEVSNVRARNTGNAIFVRLGKRHTKQAGSVRNIYIHDVVVQVPNARPDTGYPHPGPEVKEPHNLFPSSIVGLPGHRIEQVRLEDIKIEFGGGGNRQRAFVPADSLHLVPERPADYPEFSMFGELPAWGFYCRHVDGLQMKNVQLILDQKDYRKPIIVDDVLGFSAQKSTYRRKGMGRRAKALR